MSVTQLSPTPIFKAWDNNGFPLALGFVYFFAAGTNTPQAAFTDSTGGTPLPNPAQLNFRGEVSIWLNPLQSYKINVTDFFGNQIPGYPIDNIQGAIGVASNIVPSITNTFTLGTPTISFANGYFGPNNAPVFDPVSGNIGYYARTAAETAAGVTPVNYAIPSHLGTGYIYPERYGTITAGVDCSQIIWFAQLVQQQSGAPIYLAGKTYTASINANYNNICFVGAGSSQTTISIPITTIAIGTISVASNVLTVNTSASHGVWVGKAIRITGNTYNTGGVNGTGVNGGFLVTQINSTTQFLCQELNGTIPNGSGTGGSLMASSVLECGQLCNGNSATPYTGMIIRGMTLNGNSGSRPTPDTDLTDWGNPHTAISNYNVTDVNCINCWNGGVGLFINCNNFYIQGSATNCSFSIFQPPSLDFNSVKHGSADWVSNNCNFGARILDNCADIHLRAAVNNATIGGFIFSCQSVNEIHGCTVDLTVEGGCSSYGAQISSNAHSSQFKIATNGVGGIGVQEVYSATNFPIGNIYDVTTRNSQQQGVLIGGNGSNWTISSYLDGRAGGAGSNYAIQIDGSFNNILANVIDSATPQVRGINLTANSTNDNIVAFMRNTLVSDFSNSGTNNRWVARTLYGQGTAPAGVIANGAQSAAFTITVTGAAIGTGDLAKANFDVNAGGLIISAEVTAANTVTCWILNLTGAGQNPGGNAVYATVTKATP